MGLSEVFIHRTSNRKVIYKDICTFESIVKEESTEGGILYESSIEDIQSCILCEDCDTHGIYCIPIKQFLNYYQPSSGLVTDVLNTFDKLKNIDYEKNRENICALHSGESEVDPPAAEG